jgi:formylglycine-generating enzyme required for sulfatase activity
VIVAAGGAASALAATATRENEIAVKPGSHFKECASGCPTMIVVAAGKFTMGSQETEEGRSKSEGPQNVRYLPSPSRWVRPTLRLTNGDICVAVGACLTVSDNGWGRRHRPVVLVSWEEAKGYVAWLKRASGKDYRLLGEAEWEYAARAGNQGTRSRSASSPRRFAGRSTTDNT